MTRSADDGFSLRDTYVHLATDGTGVAVENTPDFWPALMSGQRRYDGRLVIASRLTEDMTHWEMHPVGEELLILLSGAVDCVLEKGGEERVVSLEAGQACLVPRGAWHRLRVREPGELVFVTYGEGTEHRPL